MSNTAQLRIIKLQTPCRISMQVETDREQTWCIISRSREWLLFLEHCFFDSDTITKKPILVLDKEETPNLIYTCVVTSQNRSAKWLLALLPCVYVVSEKGVRKVCLFVCRHHLIAGRYQIPYNKTDSVVAISRCSRTWRISWWCRRQTREAQDFDPIGLWLAWVAM